MHTKEMSEFDGDFSPPSEEKYTCYKCKQKAVTCQKWESSCGGYEDYKYECKACGHSWWVEGPDS
jgi:predicted SprT family Zn-dependent metalloprotease